MQIEDLGRFRGTWFFWVRLAFLAMERLGPVLFTVIEEAGLVPADTATSGEDSE